MTDVNDIVYGGTPEIVTGRVRVDEGGARRGAVQLAAVRMFPGAGDVTVGENGLPTSTRTREEWDALEGAVFQRLATGVEIIQVGHIVAAGLDPSGTPASLSRTIISDILRGQLQFNGIVVTDSLADPALRALHATGYAMGLQLDGLVGNTDSPNAAVVAYHGDGASSQGDVNEAYVFAASYNAPVVFFCQNNQWAISEPIALQSRIPLYQRAHGFGFPGVRVDGNDVLAVHAVTSWALERAHRGEGPTFIEAFTYRMGAHTTSDDPTKYRADEETRSWAGRDPITRLTTHLRAEGLIDDAWLAALDEEARQFGSEIRAAIPELKDLTFDELFDNVHAENTVALEAQRREYAEWTAAGEES